MKVLLSWLREFAPFDQSADEIGDALSDLGLAVEEQVTVGEGLDGIVVARVEALRPHPNADKIQLVDVDAGPALAHEGGGSLQICCGAFNMSVGDLVPLASLGTVMPGGMKIERRKLRGEWSNGMLCSAKELAFGHDHAGIMILAPDLEPGTTIGEALGIGPDVLYDLEVNPNRPDAMSVAGVARDLAARFGLPFTLPAPTVREVEPGDAPVAAVDVADPEACGRFTAKVLRNVKVGSSPAWMASRLTLLGMRPINALVDISNYVMLELGQPNHPYDLDLVAKGTLRVRRASNGEQLTTLDDVERTFTADDLLICDGDDEPVGIAGVMGGAACEIHSGTTDVLLENAWFLPISIAKTGRRLGLRSEASARFEKGTDPEALDLAVARFCQLAQQICGAEVVEGMVDVRGALPASAPATVRPSRVSALLGREFSAAEIAALLDPIGFTSTASEGGNLSVSIPSWRYDSATEIDVIEEVARMYGYSRLGATVPSAPRFGELTPRQRERRQVRRLLVGLGLSEAMPLSFLAPDDFARSGLPDDGISLLNPLVAEESVLRTSLLPGLLKAVAHNASHRNHDVGLWEIGHVFRQPPPGQLLPDERETFAVALAGRDATAAVEVWHVLAEALALPAVDITNEAAPGLHPGRSAVVSVAGEPVGVVGEVAPEVLAAHDIPDRVAWLEVDFGHLQSLPHGDHTYRLVSRFPSSDLDLAFEIAEGVSALAVARTIRDSDALVRSADLFDVYRGEQVAPGTRSLAYRLRLQAPDRTLTDAELATARAAVIAAVEAAHGATLRA